MRLLRLVFEVVLILFRWYYNPTRMKQVVDERLEREQRERSQRFRKAIDEDDADSVSGMLARIRNRLRNQDRLSGR